MSTLAEYLFDPAWLNKGIISVKKINSKFISKLPGICSEDHRKSTKIDSLDALFEYDPLTAQPVETNRKSVNGKTFF